MKKVVVFLICMFVLTASAKGWETNSDKKAVTVTPVSYEETKEQLLEEKKRLERLVLRYTNKLAVYEAALTIINEKLATLE